MAGNATAVTRHRKVCLAPLLLLLLSPLLLYHSGWPWQQTGFVYCSVNGLLFSDWSTVQWMQFVVWSDLL